MQLKPINSQNGIPFYCSWFAGNISRSQSEQLLRQKVSSLVFKIASKNAFLLLGVEGNALLTETLLLIIQPRHHSVHCPPCGLPGPSHLATSSKPSAL